MSDKTAITSVPIHDIIARRWSGRAFLADKPVAREHLLSILEAARWAPSCFGDEPWRYLVWDRFRDAAAWARAFACLAEGNQAWVKNAPLLLLATADSVFRRNGSPNRWGPHDTGAASENLCLQATALGLMAHPMGGYDEARLRAEFAIPPRFTCMAMIAVGHPAAADRLEGELRQWELAPRTRRPLSELFFDGAWEKPLAE
jgi:nitroreductase